MTLYYALIGQAKGWMTILPVVAGSVLPWMGVNRHCRHLFGLDRQLGRAEEVVGPGIMGTWDRGKDTLDWVVVVVHCPVLFLVEVLAVQRLGT
jgi:hypothetical protein